jgi:molybdate transport system substrate-binding protein
MKFLVPFLLLALLAAPSVRAQDSRQSLAVAAAADLVYCLQELDAGFAKLHPEVDVKVSTGSSGNFCAQIQNGAPFDVFLSADAGYPRTLAKAGLADADSLTTYAIGRIVLWTTKSDVDVTKGLAAVGADTVKKFAIANPGHAPYGRAAKAALEHAGLWADAESKLVLGENIAQTAQFVQTGAADAGVVALSLVLSPALKKMGHWAEIPTNFYPKLEQAAILTAHGASGSNRTAARAYLAYLRSKEARAIFDRYGFRLPEIGEK